MYFILDTWKMGTAKDFCVMHCKFSKTKYHQVIPGSVLPWQVYTQKDFKLHSGKSSEKTTGN